jgi:hypothetical protein
MARIKVRGSSKKAIVDDEDYKELSKYEWFLFDRKDGIGPQACRVTEDGEIISMAEEVMMNMISQARSIEKDKRANLN